MTAAERAEKAQLRETFGTGTTFLVSVPPSHEVAEDLVLTPPPPAVKPNRHIVIALRHMETQHANLTLKIDRLVKERDDVENAMKALR